MTKRSQQSVVREKLARDGFVSNLWAINRHIWRLGAIVYQIRHANKPARVDLNSAYGERIGLSKRHRKNCFYYTDDCLEHSMTGATLKKAVADKMNREF